MPPVVDSVLDLVGNTPLLRLTRFAPEFQIFSKLEYLNPGGSVKDRIGVGMIRAAEALGQIRPGVSTIIEPTAGNTGVGLAIAAKALGYRCILCVPTKYSREKMMLMKALGAELVLIPKELGMKGAIERCAELAASIPDAFVPQQFANPSNPDSHYATTGPEIWAQMEGRVDAVVLGAGSGGTFTGIARYLNEKNPAIRAIVVQPEGSIYCGAPLKEWVVEGVGNSFIPASLDLSLADRIIDVADADSLATARELIATEGCLVGASSGANAWAAREVAKTLPAGARVVTLFPDGAERYMSKQPVAELEL
ncbi:MAG: PLP-dependent cysteine synthase family protein [Holophagaceae bacterium]|uniref:PLP-dependent cysteine synthase family protein n=1 Tax=Candidatus Geothrix skivensis TaxID=2954439 RepID=A0A9D7SGR7_9BACT|nr:PLP-dependent cysteine synthase family protein [Candidatus Geothrix skivensis]